MPESRLARCRQAVIDAASAWRRKPEGKDDDETAELLAAVDALEVAKREDLVEDRAAWEIVRLAVERSPWSVSPDVADALFAIEKRLGIR